MLSVAFSSYEIDVYSGSPSGLGSTPVATIMLDVSDAASFQGDGDFNGDGYDDLAIGPFVVTGPVSGSIDAQDEAYAVFDAADLIFGRRSSALHDLDADGYAELLMGSRGDSVSGAFAGAVWVIPGQ